jgi:3',5'-cyclic-AMP phosphodiesterase
MRHPLANSPLQIWALEDTSVQLTWGALPPGPITALAGGAQVVLDHPGGPGSLELSGLSPRTALTIKIAWNGGRTQIETQTLPAPPGPLLCRIATVSDLHLGSSHWGASKLMLDRSGHPVPYPERCARAALAEAVAWGAELLVIKGDAVHHQLDDHFAQLGQLLDELPELPVLLIPGNHEVDAQPPCPLPAKVGTRGVPYVEVAACEDLPGIRVVVGNSTVPGRGAGSIDAAADDLADLVAMASGPFLLGLHHHFQQQRFPTYYPPGIAAPASNRFLDRLARINQPGLVTSGHTHRNRSRRHGPLVVTEVASSRDWPGVWAGYAVHEGGIRQVVRRVAASDAISWHEYSRRALFGGWELWAQGRLTQRCFTHRWS